MRGIELRIGRRGSRPWSSRFPRRPCSGAALAEFAAREDGAADDHDEGDDADDRADVRLAAVVFVRSAANVLNATSYLIPPPSSRPTCPRPPARGPRTCRRSSSTREAAQPRQLGGVETIVACLQAVLGDGAVFPPRPLFLGRDCIRKGWRKRSCCSRRGAAQGRLSPGGA